MFFLLPGLHLFSREFGKVPRIESIERIQGARCPAVSESGGTSWVVSWDFNRTFSWDLVGFSGTDFILATSDFSSQKEHSSPRFRSGSVKLCLSNGSPFGGKMIHAWWTFHIYDGLFNLHWSPICFVFLIIRLISTVPLIAGKLPARNWNSHGDWAATEPGRNRFVSWWSVG